MNILTKFFSSAFDSAKHRVCKVVGIGTYTAELIAPFGDDSCPLSGADAIYMETTEDSQPVIIGFINTGLSAGPGEKRFYSLKKDPTTGAVTESVYFYMKNDGTIELNGNQDNAVRHSKLNSALQLEVTKLNNELQKIQIALAAVGGTYAYTPVSVDISLAKISEIKTS